LDLGISILTLEKKRNTRQAALMIPWGFQKIYKKDIKSVWEVDDGVLVLQQRFFSLLFFQKLSIEKEITKIETHQKPKQDAHMYMWLNNIFHSLKLCFS